MVRYEYHMVPYEYDMFPYEYDMVPYEYDMVPYDSKHGNGLKLQYGTMELHGSLMNLDPGSVSSAALSVVSISKLSLLGNWKCHPVNRWK